ncbi:Arginine-glutamic acid dipeptide repeats protein [Folsomia candida]|uniref:Arginine-glutamic acid dipeptide repeats protein n=1 Tax=Folsomia candida TaxID=158441 RepID=A0A226F4E8_FOLCA|nr:Arginine-glutamic acid dipeptide repeats protein [Folsomia candida]
MELDRSRSPCLFGITLQQGAQLVAGVNIVLGIWFFVIFSLYCFTVGSDIDEVAGGKVTGMIIAYWIIIGVLVFLSVLINIILLKGAYQKSQEKVKIFLMGLIVLVVVGFIVTLVRHFSLTAFLLEVSRAWTFQSPARPSPVEKPVSKAQARPGPEKLSPGPPKPIGLFVKKARPGPGPLGYPLGFF